MPEQGGPSNLEINRGVRRILVANWIDLGRISIGTIRTTVHLRGIIQKLPGSDSTLTAEQLEVMYRKIKAVKGVNTVQVQLRNWTRNRSTGAWEKLLDAAAEARKHASTQKTDQGTYEIR